MNITNTKKCNISIDRINQLAMTDMNCVHIEHPNYYFKIGNFNISIYRKRKINKFQKKMWYIFFGIEIEELKDE